MENPRLKKSDLFDYFMALVLGEKCGRSYIKDIEGVLRAYSDKRVRGRDSTGGGAGSMVSGGG